MKAIVNAEKLIGWVEIAAVSLLVFYMFGLGLGALRAWRTGQSGVEVAAWFTVALTGLGFALAGAWGGSRLGFTIAGFLSATPLMYLLL